MSGEYFWRTSLVAVDSTRRWANQWRTVVVHLSSWDIGYRISKLGIELARERDSIYSTAPEAIMEVLNVVTPGDGATVSLDAVFLTAMPIPAGDP
jgi:hypothetical protein